MEKILEKRFKRGKIEYSIQCANSPAYENCWEPEDNLRNAPEAIKDYEKERKKYQPAERKSKRQVTGRKRGRPRNWSAAEVTSRQLEHGGSSQE